MARRIIKKVGGERIGSGNKMTVTATGYGYSTHDVSKVRRTSMSFGTLVPMGMWLLTTGSRLRIELDALITSNALLYQLYGSAKFQLDVYSARVALYNPKMLLNLNDQGYDIDDILFPQMDLFTKGIESAGGTLQKQLNDSSLLRYLGIAYNGQNQGAPTTEVGRRHMAMWLMMYYQVVKEYYANRQEKRGYMIHAEFTAPAQTVVKVQITSNNVAGATIPQYTSQTSGIIVSWRSYDLWGLYIDSSATSINARYNIVLVTKQYGRIIVADLFSSWTTPDFSVDWYGKWATQNWDMEILGWAYVTASDTSTIPRLVQWDLKAVDRMMMSLMKNVDSPTATVITNLTEMPYGASFKRSGAYYSIDNSQEGLCVGTYQSDVFNNWLDNTTINNLNAKNKIKVDANGEFSIDMLNLTQKMYNYDMRIGVTDGTLEEWREMTYAQVGKSKSLKPVYEGGLSREILFDMIISTASTAEDPLGSIASRGNFGSKRKGGYVQIDTDEEKMVMVIAKITPRLVYNQGNDWTTTLTSLDALHKPALDKIGYQNLITDTMMAAETIVTATGLITYSAGKQPAWQWYRTNYDDALGNMAGVEDYKVFGRSYEMVKDGTGNYRIKDLTTYIDPTKFNDVFAIKSLDAMNFDVQVGMDAKLTLVMSEEVIPTL